MNPAFVGPPAPAPSPLLVTGASLLLPGTGQLWLGRRRWIAYAALEMAGWAFHLDRRRTGRRVRAEYRDLAWTEARSASPHPRLDGDFRYYETLETWIRSGAFDVDPVRAGVQPETDPTAFNGSIWTLARDLYLPAGEEEGGPAMERALRYYEDRAYSPALLWDWTGMEAELARYVGLIDTSDAALRSATIVLGAVVANHLLAAVDAFVASRGSMVAVTTSAALDRGVHGPALQWRVEVSR